MYMRPSNLFASSKIYTMLVIMLELKTVRSWKVFQNCNDASSLCRS
jgi:hypothetical protein